jgi:hypothetical protein
MIRFDQIVAHPIYSIKSSRKQPLQPRMSGGKSHSQDCATARRAGRVGRAIDAAERGKVSSFLKKL